MTMSELAQKAIATYPAGTRVRHKGEPAGTVYVVGHYSARKDGRISFTLLHDGGHPKSRQIRAGRLLAEYEVVPH